MLAASLLAKTTSRCATTASSFRCAPPTAAPFPEWFTAASATGQTVFVEPLEAIDSNNRLVQLGEDEIAEIARILEELTERVRADRGPLEAAAPR